MIIDTQLALASIGQLIKLYQDSSAPQTEQQDNFLLDINNRVRAIISTYRGWMKYSVVLDAKTHGKKLTQGMVTEAYVSAQKKIIGFIFVTVGTLLRDVRLELAKSDEHHSGYKKLLAEIEAHVSSVLDNIRIRFSLEANVKNHSVVDVINRIVFRPSLTTIIELSELLGGRCFPANQGLDPIRNLDLSCGFYSGSCYGHIKSWSNEISRLGYYESMHIHDEEVDNFQNRPAFNKLLYANWISDIYSNSDFRHLLNSMLNQVKEDKVYILDLCPIEGYGHVIGVRTIPGTQEYEFYDPNFGTFVFAERENFIKFLAHLLTNEYYYSFVNQHHIAGGQLRLYESGSQPEHAKPCLPPFTSQRPRNTRSAKLMLGSLTHSLASIARTQHRELADISYFDRHWNDYLYSGCVGVAFTMMGGVVSYVLSGGALFNNASALSLCVYGAAASVTLERDAAFISMATNNLFKMFRSQETPKLSSKMLAKMRVDKKHAWVNKLSKKDSVENNHFIFKKRDEKDNLNDDRPLKKPSL